MHHRKFSTNYHTSPTVTVIYSGNDHRSWIDVIILYNEIFRNKSKSLFDNKYHYQTITKSTTMINTIPNATNQVLAFDFGNILNDIIFHGKSYKTFKMIKNIKTHKRVYSNFNLLLRWGLRLQAIIPGSSNLVVFQGESLQLDPYLKCKASKSCPELKAFWIQNS